VVCAGALFPQGSVVISQIYGGGGNVGATFRNDFIELLNRTDKSISLEGWSVQYASSSGTSCHRTLLHGSIAPGAYYLIQEAEGNGGGTALYSMSAVGGINLSATTGKIALVSNSSVLTGATPSGSQFVDFVACGSSNGSEGSPVPTLSNTTAAFRRSNGCTDTNNNAQDFSTGPPNPRNFQSPLNLCVATPTVPSFTAAGMANAGSYTGSAISPGEILTSFGSAFGPSSLTTYQWDPDGRIATSLAGTRVLFNGVPAPILYALNGQVSSLRSSDSFGSIEDLKSANLQQANLTEQTLAVVPSIGLLDRVGVGEPLGERPPATNGHGGRGLQPIQSGVKIRFHSSASFTRGPVSAAINSLPESSTQV